ncbi:MAG: hypothetical protein PVI82_07780 [Desulfobacterales bacterium]
MTVISFFLEGKAATKCHHNCTEILSKSILDIWEVSKPSRAYPSTWIRLFYLLQVIFFGTPI